MAADCKPRVGSVHIGDEEQCGITQHIYYLLNIFWISTVYGVSTLRYLAHLCPVPKTELSPMKAAVHNIVWGAVPLLAVVSDWHINILLASIICHLELEHGWSQEYYK